MFLHCLELIYNLIEIIFLICMDTSWCVVSICTISSRIYFVRVHLSLCIYDIVIISYDEVGYTSASPYFSYIFYQIITFRWSSYPRKYNDDLKYTSLSHLLSYVTYFSFFFWFIGIFCCFFERHFQSVYVSFNTFAFLNHRKTWEKDLILWKH